MKQPTPTDQLPELMFALLRYVKRELSREELNVPSWLHLETLRFVEEGKSPAMHELASYLRVQAPTATGLVAALVKEGFLERTKVADDRRRVELRVTTKGKACLKEAAQKRTTAFARVVSGLSVKDRKEFARLISIITRIP